MTYEELILHLAAVGVVISEDMLATMRRYLGLLSEANRKLNLTAIEDETEMVRKHLLDCLLVLPFLPAQGRLMDVGSGAGLPGIPLAIAQPELHVTLMDSTEKKVAFLRAVIAGLGLEGRVSTVLARAEQAGRDPKHRHSYDVTISRAVARLNVLAEYCLPLTRVGGLFLAMKGPAAAAEAEEAQCALALLGGRISEVQAWYLPMGGEQRSLVIVNKVSITPHSYPRREGVPAKEPL